MNSPKSFLGSDDGDDFDSRAWITSERNRAKATYRSTGVVLLYDRDNRPIRSRDFSNYPSIRWVRLGQILPPDQRVNPYTKQPTLGSDGRPTMWDQTPGLVEAPSEPIKFAKNLLAVKGPPTDLTTQIHIGASDVDYTGDHQTAKDYEDWGLLTIANIHPISPGFKTSYPEVYSCEVEYYRSGDSKKSGAASKAASFFGKVNNSSGSILGSLSRSGSRASSRGDVSRPNSRGPSTRRSSMAGHYTPSSPLFQATSVDDFDVIPRTPSRGGHSTRSRQSSIIGPYRDPSIPNSPLAQATSIDDDFLKLHLHMQD